MANTSKYELQVTFTAINGIETTVTMASFKSLTKAYTALARYNSHSENLREHGINSPAAVVKEVL